MGYCIYLPQCDKGLVVQMFPTKQDHMVLLHSLESKLCYQHGYLELESVFAETGELFIGSKFSQLSKEKGHTESTVAIIRFQ